MWCIPRLTPEYIERMEHLLDLYALPYDARYPVVCIDEKSKQLLQDARAARAANERHCLYRDYEYKRNGTRNIFCAVESKGGTRILKVTKRRTKKDFAEFVRHLVDEVYRDALEVQIVCDNLNTHFPSSFIETFGEAEARRILARIRFHYTPKHASWLDMAEIELSILSRGALKGRIKNEEELVVRVATHEKARNASKACIHWRFTTQDARMKLKYGVGNL